MKSAWGRGLFIALGLALGVALVVWLVANRQAPSRDEAVAWAARIAKACRCDQELRIFGYDPQS